MGATSASWNEYVQRHQSELLGISEKRALEVAKSLGMSVRVVHLEAGDWYRSNYVRGRVTLTTVLGVVQKVVPG